MTACQAPSDFTRCFPDCLRAIVASSAQQSYSGYDGQLVAPFSSRPSKSLIAVATPRVRAIRVVLVGPPESGQASRCAGCWRGDGKRTSPPAARARCSLSSPQSNSTLALARLTAHKLSCAAKAHVPMPLRHGGCRAAFELTRSSAADVSLRRWCSAEELQLRIEAGPHRLQLEVSPPAQMMRKKSSADTRMSSRIWRRSPGEISRPL